MWHSSTFSLNEVKTVTEKNSIYSCNENPALSIDRPQMPLFHSRCAINNFSLPYIIHTFLLYQEMMYLTFHCLAVTMYNYITT